MRNLFVTLLVMFQYTQNSWGDVVDPKSGKQITSFIKDAEVQEMLEGTKEFRDCRDLNNFDPAVTDTEKEKKIQAAEKCFKDKITKGKGLKELEELSKKLDLENYQLIRSKNVQDIQKYLDDKMYKSLTGVDRNEQDFKKMQEDLKFGRKKIIDHKVFIELYKMQLGKNSIFEISRFCFEDLRLNNPPSGDSFAEHWANYGPGTLSIQNLNDQGIPKFGKQIDTTDKQKIYTDIFKSIQGPNGKGLSDQQLSQFFIGCGKMIVPLCDQFQNSMVVTGSTKIVVNGSKPSVGGAACITKNRLQEYRKANSKAEKIIKYLENEAKDDKEFKLILSNLENVPLKIYGDGQDPNEESIDDLTNYTSNDMLTQGDGNSSKKLEECKQRPELASCEGLISDNESFEKAKHDIESEMTLKRLVEMEKIKKIVTEDKKSLKNYLEDNGYHDILKKFNENKLKEDDIEIEVGKAFEAKKKTLLEQIHSKLGKRQISNQQNTINQQDADEVVQEVKEEKGRLAQMVLFNNIITSHLELRDEKDNIVGTNINVWNREKNALETGQIDPSLFQNIKQSNGKNSGLGKDSKIKNFDFIDEFLGKEEEKNKKIK